MRVGRISRPIECAGSLSYRKREMGRFGWGGGREDDSVCIYMTLPRAQSRGQIKCLSSTGTFADLFASPCLTCSLPCISLASTSFGASSFMGHTFIYTYVRFLLWKASLVLVTAWPFFPLELCRKQAAGCLLSMKSLIQRLAPLMKRAGKPPSVVSWNILAVVPGTDQESTRGPQNVWLWQRWLSKDLLEAVSSLHNCDCLEGETAPSAFQIAFSWVHPSLLTLDPQLHREGHPSFSPGVQRRHPKERGGSAEETSEREGRKCRDDKNSIAQPLPHLLPGLTT